MFPKSQERIFFSNEMEKLQMVLGYDTYFSIKFGKNYIPSSTSTKINIYCQIFSVENVYTTTKIFKGILLRGHSQITSPT